MSALISATPPPGFGFRGKPERAIRCHVVNHSTRELHSGFKTDACFAFQHINAYEKGAELVVALCALEDHSLIGDLYLDRLQAWTPIHRARLRSGPDD